MSHSHIDNTENAANFINAFEAAKQKPRKSRGLVLGIMTPRQERYYKEQAAKSFYHEDYYGCQERNPEDALIDMIDGTLDEESTALLLGSDEPVEDEHSYFVDGLTDQEKELVLKYGDNPDCNVELNPMRATFTKPETLKQIKRRYHGRYGESGYWHPEKVASKARMELEYVQRTFRSKLTYVPVKPALESLTHEEQLEDSLDLTEARDLSREFKRRSAVQMYGNLYQNMYSYNLDRRYQNDRQHRPSIRHQNWSEQLPFCSKIELAYDDYRERITFEASIRHMEEEWEDIKEEGLQFELGIWEDYINFAQEKQRHLRDMELMVEAITSDRYEIDQFDPYLSHVA